MKIDFKEQLFFTISLSALLMFSGLALAQETTASPAPLKIGVVDVLKVYNAWEVQKKADTQFQPMRDKLQEKDKYITTMKDELRKQQSVLKQEQITQRESIIKKEERDLRDQVEELSGKIEERAKELTKELDTNLQEIYATLVEKEGYTLILEKRAVRYYKPGMDLTKQITEMLNKKEGAPDSAKSTPAKSESAPPLSAPKKAK